MIASNVVLTAAHCGPLNTNNVAYISAFDRQSTNHGAIQTNVRSYRAHPDYNSGVLNDYALIRLDDHFCPSSFVSLETTDGPTEPPAGTGLTVIGVGATSSGGPAADSLLEVDVDVVDGSRCDELYTNSGGIKTDVMFCAGDVANGGVDSCQGDSGGPIVKKENDGSHTQVGVVSWGVGCAWPGYPGVYAKVSHVASWITDIACNQWGGTGGICGGTCNGQDVGHENEGGTGGGGGGGGNGDGNNSAGGGGASSCGNGKTEVALEFTTDGYG